ncbi:DNA-binding IclR family transcriptional regulator [Chromobacterium alkanivorans]|uniref:IclR family transcriptional regulator n=1 Tax=Chromobacterium alkanivorans TaxID=1071719 RepID=UPI00216831A3|nr:IclR family transcriptional regulator [Chromobacterium alkanivorans]MCS3803383.1 DNA-binding IclR family transcriptional regulator [Chromobacterium alkanivorans]MCS3817507.1 DNA-binding IclR family transcriptional regulator [Chromobacterium alkanivorans]MCS3872749.1 DNA-binding IclR family transcriptional regulator [Chromobacterium alkanivorans]
MKPNPPDWPLLTPSAADDQGKRQFVTALARGLELLRCFTPDGKQLSNQELARRTGLPRPTVTRLTHTLTQLGYLRCNAASGKYQLDIGVLAFGYALLSNLSICNAAQTRMTELARQARASVAIGARDRLNMVYLDVAHSDTHLTMRRQIGSRIPLHSTAMGKACLAAMPEPERAFVLNHLGQRFRDDWSAIRLSLEQAFRDHAERGFCLSLGEWQRDVNSVGVPMRHPSHGLIVFSCGGPGFQLKPRQLEEDIGPRLVDMVRNLEAVC